MAESMQGLHRTCRCAEVTTEMVGSEVTLNGMGGRKQEIKEESCIRRSYVTVPWYHAADF